MDLEEQSGRQISKLISYADTHTILLFVDSKMIDLDSKKAVAEERGLGAKSEFHITIIGSRTGEKIKGHLAELGEAKRQGRWEQIVAFGKQIDWEVELIEEYYYIEKVYEIEVEAGEEVSQTEGVEIKRETRRSIIQMAKIRGINEFYSSLNNLLGTNFEPQSPAHVTLFTTSTNPEKIERGIGVNTIKEFEAMKPESV